MKTWATRVATAPLLHGIAWFAVLQAAYSEWPLLSQWLIEQATVRPAAWVLTLAAPGLEAQALGARLVVEGGALHVLKGCEGADLALLSASAMLAVPGSWRRRLAGLALVLTAVFVLNQLRVLLLLQAHLVAPAWFDRLHTLWLPLAMVLALAALLWVWTAPQRGR